MRDYLRTYRTEASISTDNSAILLILKVVLFDVVPKGLDHAYPRILLDTQNIACGCATYQSLTLSIPYSVASTNEVKHDTSTTEYSHRA